MNRRRYGPSQHGQRRKGKLSDFPAPAARQAEAQGLPYGDPTEGETVPPHLCRAGASMGDTGENLIGLLGAVWTRRSIAPNCSDHLRRPPVREPRPMSTVNGKRVNIASYRVKEGVISVRERSRQLAIVPGSGSAWPTCPTITWKSTTTR